MKRIHVVALILACILSTTACRQSETANPTVVTDPQTQNRPTEYWPSFDQDDYEDETLWSPQETVENGYYEETVADDYEPDDGGNYDETDDGEGSVVEDPEDFYDEIVTEAPENLDEEPETVPQQPEETEAPTAPAGTMVQSDVAEPLTWVKINAIPVAKAGMSETELRKICTDFMRLQISFAWTPSRSLSYRLFGRQVNLNAGAVYGGLPYVSSNFGNLYSAMEYYDEKTGVLNASAADGDIVKIIGNQCSASAYWAWSRISNSISFGGTQTALHKNGCLRLGNYTYSDSINNFHSESIRTANICKANGEQTMYEAYALLLPADGISMYTGSAGHVRMVSGKANVVRNPNGTINPERSSITFLDQTDAWTTATQPNGKIIKIQGGVDVTVSFRSLYNSGYLPFRIPELAGKDGVQKAELSFSQSDSSASVAALSSAKVRANYPLSDVTVTVKNSAGAVKYRYTKHINDLNIREYTISGAIKSNVLSSYADGTYTVEISCRVGTGEKLVAYTGNLRK